MLFIQALSLTGPVSSAPCRVCPNSCWYELICSTRHVLIYYMYGYVATCCYSHSLLQSVVLVYMDEWLLPSKIRRENKSSKRHIEDTNSYGLVSVQS